MPARWRRPSFALALSGILAASCAGTPPQSARPPSSAVHAPESSLTPDVSRAAAASGAALADLALSMLGQPYRFGGAAPGGFDCSGLVAYAAAGAGIQVPRTAHQQFASGKPVARGELRAGDLVFMHLKHKELHVGIAIGDERFVHAPSKGGYVRIDSLDAAPYARGFLGARRLSIR
jgi:cell wall-associated NlpC family hydrolase